MHFIEVPDHIADKLSNLPVTARGGRLERAINRALDADGWPNDTASIAADYWFVVIWTRTGMLHGHVGPILGKQKADAVASSWKKSGSPATLTRRAVGPALTNAHITGHAQR